MTVLERLLSPGFRWSVLADYPIIPPASGQPDNQLKTRNRNFRFMDAERLLGPWDPEASLELFRSIKHTRLEGLIIEHEVEQTLLSRAENHGWRPVKALVLRRITRTQTREFLVITNSPEACETRNLVTRLRQTGEAVLILRVSGSELVLIEGPDGENYSPPRPFLRPAENVETTHSGAVSHERVLAAFWGFAVQAPHLAQRFTREIVIKDLFVTPASRALWDLDRFLVHGDGRILYLETKHKFPFGRSFSFGMNIGEVHNARLLQSVGIETYHIILVKPRWKKELSSTYLFYDRPARESALWIVADMAQPGFFGKDAVQAPASTALHGKRGVDFVSLDVRKFRMLGTNAEPSPVLSDQLFGFIGGAELDGLDEKTLRRHRLE